MAETPKHKDLLYEIDRLKKQIEQLRSEGDRYGLRWHPVPEDFEADAENSLPVLREKGGKFKDIELDPSADHNVLIEGDNYHALSVLSYTHKGKVSVIYIDPPYNTGSDGFRYHDKRIAKEFPNGVEVPADHPYRHTYWLSFMEKRLELAKNLLKPTGVIFISIDNVEQAALRLLCDKVFGEKNFVGVLIWRKKEGGGQADAYFATEHEYILVYAKSEQFQWKDEEIPADEAEFGKEDKKGKFTAVKLAKWGNTARREDRPKMYFPIKSPDGKNIHPLAPDGGDGRWRVGRKRMDMLVEKELVFWKQRDGKWVPYEKVYFDGEEVKKIKERSILYDLANTADGTNELTEIFGKKDVFENPKPTELIKFFLRYGADSDALVLDFFAGSGTTGHAVLKVNQEDTGQRRFILCTNNENDICEKVTYERLKRVMKGYTPPSKDGVNGLGGNLKYLKTAFVPRHVEYGLTDEARLDLTRRANLLLALKENTFTSVTSADRYEIFSSPSRVTGIYFTEDKEQLGEMLKSLTAKAKGRTVVVYIFSWEKGSYKAGFEDCPDFHFEDIPEPILDVYRSIGY